MHTNLQNNNIKIIEKELFYKLGGIFFEIQQELGRFCRERQYGDVLEKKLKERKINFKREYPIEIADRKSNFADFFVENRILIDLKTKPFVEKDDYFQMKRYLEISGLELGLIVNFKDKYLKPKRVLNTFRKLVDSDKFVVSDRNRGFTMVELLVAMSLFVVFMAITTGSFIRILRTQRLIAALMEANDNASLAIEQIAREIRTGYNFSKPSETELQFVNADNTVVFYRLNQGTIERGTQNAFLQRTYRKITADNIEIKNFRINLIGNGSGDGFPARITISLSVTIDYERLENTLINIQTTLSSRVLDT